MIFSKLATALAAVPLITLSGGLVAIAQNASPYANWTFLYQDSFENSDGQEITQEWSLKPRPIRQNNRANFTLLARRTPASSNGTAAAAFDYVADCETLGYAIEQTTFLDGNDEVLDVQTAHRVMESADPESPFYKVLNDICDGAYN